ncbi:MAG: tripartite tricarboxylate transporter substrate binding protein [Polaromonas sp.]|uniref:Bug family tripartite tricarboxylate transporter substrate binding protein n=1 Tax=Polaromonas sp. TaxID=1869339 RepID=UPI002733916E|nr:tripartite tricarboxylate transporter substrate binding protein [Polaromonas sp.]MDP3799409.1 tripartite tricarboxylate transporter substrate binding protein [Polaromonas sp.]
MKLLRRSMVLGVLAGLAWGGIAQAQTYPSKPIRIVLPYSAGGPADVMVRAISQKLGDSWGQPFVVDNKPGANEIIAADLVAKSPGDGYTFLVASDGAYSLNQNLYPKIPYDPVKDFVPVAKLAIGNLMLVTRPDFPAANVKEFIDYVKRNPGKLNYGSIGAGGVNHLASAWFNSINGLQMEHVAFKGLPPAVQELMAGRIDAMFAVTGGVAPFLESGKIKALAVSGRNRQPAAPNVPTFAEVGYPSFDASYYFGVVAPKGTPADITSRFARDMSKIINAADFKSKYLQPLGFEAVGDTPEQFAAFLISDRELGAQKVKVSGAKLD